MTVIIRLGDAMFLYDRMNNIINAGDILRFDNNKLYVVLLCKDHYVLQNLEQYIPPLRLESFLRTSQVPAIRICNIIKFN